MELGDLGWVLGTQPPEGSMCHSKGQLSDCIILLAHRLPDTQCD